MLRSLVLIVLFSLLSFNATSKEVPISSLPNAGKISLAEARLWAKKLTDSVQTILPKKHLLGEMLEAGFIPDNEMFFTFKEIGRNRKEENEAINALTELEQLRRGSVNELLSKEATQRLCNQRDSWGDLMRSFLLAGMVIKYHMYIGDTAIGTATITKDSRCTVK